MPTVNDLDSLRKVIVWMRAPWDMVWYMVCIAQARGIVGRGAGNTEACVSASSWPVSRCNGVCRSGNTNPGGIQLKDKAVMLGYAGTVADMVGHGYGGHMGTARGVPRAVPI